MDFVDTLDDADVLEAASSMTDRHGSDGAKRHLSGSFDGSESDKDASDGHQRRGNNNSGKSQHQQQQQQQQRGGGGKANVPKVGGPLLPPRFTFRQPSLALHLLKEYKKLTGKRNKQRPKHRAPPAKSVDGGIPPPPLPDGGETDAHTDPHAKGTSNERHHQQQQRVAVSPIRSRSAADDASTTPPRRLSPKATPEKLLEDDSTASNVPLLALNNMHTVDVSLPGILSPLEEGRPPPLLNKGPSWRNQRMK